MKKNNRYRFRVKVNYCKRLAEALKYQGLTMNSTLSDVEQVLKNKVYTQSEIDTLYTSMIRILEPPYCKMSHCESHTTYGFCGCGKNLQPSKCDIHKGYIKRVKEREVKSRADLLPLVRELYKDDDNYKGKTDAEIYELIDTTAQIRRIDIDTKYYDLKKKIKELINQKNAKK